MIDWDKPFCPLCGGPVTDVPSPPRAEPSAPAVVEKISSAQREPALVPPPPGQAAASPLAPPVPQVPPLPQAPLPTAPPFAQASVPPVPLAPARVPAPPAQVQVPPLPPIAPSGGVRVPEAPLPPSVPPLPQAPPMAETISQIHQATAGTPPPPQAPQPGGFFSQIHQTPHPQPRPVPGNVFSGDPLSVLPKSGMSSAPNANAGFPGDQGTDRPSVTLQDLTDRIDGSEASLDNALGALLKSGPPLDFSKPTPASEEPAPMPFTMRHANGEVSKKDVLSPNLAELMGINSLADFTDNARAAAPQNLPQPPFKPQVPPPAQDDIPDLPDDKPKGHAWDDDSDFLKMFPGVGG